MLISCHTNAANAMQLLGLFRINMVDADNQNVVMDSLILISAKNAMMEILLVLMDAALHARLNLVGIVSLHKINNPYAILYVEILRS